MKEDREVRRAVIDHLEGIEGAPDADALRTMIAELPEPQRTRIERWLRSLAAARGIDPWVGLRDPEIRDRVLVDHDVDVRRDPSGSGELPRSGDDALLADGDFRGTAGNEEDLSGTLTAEAAPEIGVLHETKARTARAPKGLLSADAKPLRCRHGHATCSACLRVRGWSLRLVKQHAAAGTLEELVRRGLL